MIEQDTIKLLRECDAGVKMGIKSIDDVIDRAESRNLKELLNSCKDEHDKIDTKLQELLDKYNDDGKDPNFMVEKKAKLKTEVKMQMESSDNTIADLMTDGCNMGVKSLNRYLNQYAAADKVSKDITKRLINLEAQLAVDLRKFLYIL